MLEECKRQRKSSWWIEGVGNILTRQHKLQRGEVRSADCVRYLDRPTMTIHATYRATPLAGHVRRCKTKVMYDSNRRGVQDPNQLNWRSGAKIQSIQNPGGSVGLWALSLSHSESMSHWRLADRPKAGESRYVTNTIAPMTYVNTVCPSHMCLILIGIKWSPKSDRQTSSRPTSWTVSLVYSTRWKAPGVIALSFLTMAEQTASTKAPSEPLSEPNPELTPQQRAEMLADEDPLLISQSLTYVTDDGSVLHSFQSAPFSTGAS